MNRGTLHAASTRGLARLIALTMVAALAAVSFAALPAEAARRPAGTFEVEGSLSLGHPLTLRRKGVTQSDFFRSCDVPESQGLDGYVIEVPDRLRRTAARTFVSGEGFALAVDLDLYYYDVACNEIGSTSTADRTEFGAMPAGTAYVVVTSLMGTQIEFLFTAEAFRP